MNGGRAGKLPGTHVTKRLCLTVVLFVGVICVSGGYVLGNLAHNEAKRNNAVITKNLTNAADGLFKKAKRLTPKTVSTYNPDELSSRLLEIFHCDCTDCGQLKNYSVVDFVRNLINFEVSKLIRTINNATEYLNNIR